MDDKAKLSNDFEEQIQNLAGDIYIHVEDKVSTLLSTLSANLASQQILTNEPIEQNKDYQLLQQLQQKTQAELEQLQRKLTEKEQKALVDIEQLQQEKSALAEKLSLSDEALKNNTDSNKAKQLENDTGLKEKNVEITNLNQTITALTAELTDQKRQLNEQLLNAEKQIDTLNKAQEKYQDIESNLKKSDKDNVAKLETQRQKIVELEAELAKVDKEFSTFKSEQRTLVESTEQTITTLNTENTKLAQTAKESTALFVVENEKNVVLEKDLASVTLEFSTFKTEQMAALKSTKEDLAQVNSDKKLLTQLDKDNVAALTIADDKNAQLAEELSQIKDDFSLFQADKNKLVEFTSQSLDKAKVEISQHNEKIAQLSEQLASANESQKQSVKLDAQQQQTIHALTAEAEGLQKELEQNQKQQQQDQDNIQQQNTVIDQAKNQIEQLTVSLNNEQKNLIQQQKELQQLTQKNSVLDKQQITALEKIKVSESSNTQLQNELKKNKEQLNTLTQDYQKQTAKLSGELSNTEKAFEAEQKQMLKVQLAAAEDKKRSVEQFEALQKANDELVLGLEKSQLNVNDNQKEISTLQNKLKQAKEDQLHVQKRLDSVRNKQEKDNDEVRETIKYLRDENHDVTAKSTQKISELEEKLTEYRLRFEYAQKQLSKIENDK